MSLGSPLIHVIRIDLSCFPFLFDSCVDSSSTEWQLGGICFWQTSLDVITCGYWRTNGQYLLHHSHFWMTSTFIKDFHRSLHLNINNNVLNVYFPFLSCFLCTNKWCKYLFFNRCSDACMYIVKRLILFFAWGIGR